MTKTLRTMASKPGHMYVFTDNAMLLYLGNGALLRTGDQALTGVHGHVYMDVGFMSMNGALNLLVDGLVATLRDKVKDRLTRKFASIEPTELCMNAAKVNLVDFMVVNNVKRGVDVGWLRLADTVSIVTGHDFVTMDTAVTGNKLVRAYVAVGSQAPLMFVRRG